jgi:hypothetical protein
MVRPTTPPGVVGPTTLVARFLQRKPPGAQCAGRAFASLARSASPSAPVPEANSL